jgi:hypothetical protein
MDFDLPNHARCIGCNYALRGLVDPRCPECGGVFDPHDAATFLITKPSMIGWVVILGIVLTFVHGLAVLCSFSAAFVVRDTAGTPGTAPVADALLQILAAPMWLVERVWRPARVPTFLLILGVIANSMLWGFATAFAVLRAFRRSSR